MRLNEEKLKRLVKVCRMYYEENKTQAEIAAFFSVSRPMVSKLLSEAKALGIVKICIVEATSFHQIMAERLREKYGIRSAVVVPLERDEERTDGAIVAAAYDLLLSRLGDRGCLGIGWGSLIGRLADYVAEKNTKGSAADGNGEGNDEGNGDGLSGIVCPLIGNAAASYRSYHPNELVRIISKETGLSPAYIFGPAIAETEAEKEIYLNTDAYRQIKELWQRLDVAVVNVSNYPSSPDMATAFRFGTRLSEEKASGHILSYFYDRQGRVISEEDDRLLRISREELGAAGSVVALCASGVKGAGAAGALLGGVITDVILNEELAAELLGECEV